MPDITWPDANQLWLLVFFAAYALWGARFVGALGGAFRPIRGLEARPAYWMFGFAAFGLIMPAAVALADRGNMALTVVGVITFAVALAYWLRRRVWLDDAGLHAVGLFAKAQAIPASDLSEARLSTSGAKLAVFSKRGGPPIVADLDMDGLDGVYAAFARSKLPGVDWKRFQAARWRARRR